MINKIAFIVSLSLMPQFSFATARDTTCDTVQEYQKKYRDIKAAIKKFDKDSSLKTTERIEVLQISLGKRNEDLAKMAALLNDSSQNCVLGASVVAATVPPGSNPLLYSGKGYAEYLRKSLGSTMAAIDELLNSPKAIRCLSGSAEPSEESLSPGSGAQ